MLSRREIALILLLIILIAGTAYFFLFLQPAMAEIDAITASITNKEDELENAQIIESQYQVLQLTRDGLQPEWEAFELGVPEWFDDAEVLRVIQNVIIRYTETVSAGFPSHGLEAADEEGPVTVYPVSLSFGVRYEDIAPILDGFKDEALVCRVIDYSLSPDGGAGTAESFYNISMNLEFLTQNQ
jgi:Tfp pilus assembly protein PilO